MKLAAIILLFANSILAQDFAIEAPALVNKLRTNITTHLVEKIKEDGIVAAIPYCHENVKSLVKEAAGDASKKFEFGRTTRKLRNQGNAPKDWMEPYLDQFSKTTQKDNPVQPVFGKLPNGKQFYLAPIYIIPPCLVCHGEKLATETQNKLKKLYPNDLATGYKLGEFRGLMWVKEK